MKQVRVLELYSGIGGMHCALNDSGCKFEVVTAIDVNTVTNKIYKHNFPQTRLLDHGIEALTVKQLDKLRIDMILMSPPCQPFTRVGKKRDAEDVRTKSFLHLLDLLPKLSHCPCYILVENVKGFETSNTRERLIKTLEQCQFNYQEFLLTPLQFGVPNARLRYFLIAKRKPEVFAFETSSQVMTDLPHSALDWLVYKTAATSLSGSETVSAAEDNLTTNKSKRKTGEIEETETELSPGICSHSAAKRCKVSGEGDQCTDVALSKKDGKVLEDDDNNQLVSNTSISSGLGTSVESLTHRRLSDTMNTSNSSCSNSNSKPELHHVSVETSKRDQRSCVITSKVTSGGHTSAQKISELSSTSKPSELSSADKTSELFSPKEISLVDLYGCFKGDCPLCKAQQDVWNPQLADLENYGHNMRQVEGENSKANWPCMRLQHFMETQHDGECFEKYLLPDKDLKRFIVMDIVNQYSRKSICFTKRYGHFMEGAGSIVQMTTNVQDVIAASQFKIQAVETKNRDQWGETEMSFLRKLKLRYFTPREIANLLCFPQSYSFPEDLSTIQLYRVLGNSLNVHVVSILIRLMLLGDS